MKEQLAGIRAIMMRAAALVPTLAIAVAPCMDMLTHGSGTLLAEAEHAALHAERGEVGQTLSHHHHDASDHDHAEPALLPQESATKVAFGGVIEPRNLPVMTDVIREGPRRPPRSAALIG